MKNFMSLLGINYKPANKSNCNAFENVSSKKRQIGRNSSLVDLFFHKRREGEGLRYPKRSFFMLAAGMLSIGIGVLSSIWQPYMIIFKWKLIFEDDGEIFNLWKTPPVDLYIKIYLFNVTNAADYLKSSAQKIQLSEVGPYVYRELLSHENITFFSNGTLLTNPSHPLIFQEHLSEGNKEDDVFFLPNIALLSIAHVASKHSYLFRLPLNLLIRQTQIFPLEKQTAKQFMFGYESTLTTLGNTFFPNWIHFDRVGLIDRMYDFDGDFETFYTGSTDESLSGLYESYLGSPSLKQWQGSHCNNIRNASDGTKFKSFIQEDEQLLFFRKSMCRPQRLVQLKNNYEVDGLLATMFVFEENALDNGEVNEQNKCFCRYEKCLMRGLIDVTDCYYGFPIALSYPHFYEGDTKLISNVDGLSPNKTLHSSFFLINALSGLPLKLSVKFQINMAMGEVSGIASCERFSNIVIPALWFEITMHKLPTSLRNRFLFYLHYLQVFDRLLRYALFICGGLLLLLPVIRASFTLSNLFVPSYGLSSRIQQYEKANERFNRRSSILKTNSSKREKGSVCEKEQFLA